MVVPEAVDVDVVVLVVGWDGYCGVAFLAGYDVLEEDGMVAGIVVEDDTEGVGWGAAGDGPTESEG